MTRSQAKVYSIDLKNKYWESEDEDDNEIGWALEFAIADMNSLQDIMDVVSGIVDE